MAERRKRVGFLWPADGLNDAEYLKFLPAGLDWLVARYDAGTETEDLTPETLAAYARPEVMSRAARLLGSVAPDVVACGDHAASFIAGQTGADGMAAAVGQVLRCPVTTMAEATQQALRAIGAKTIALISPYAKDVTDPLLDSMKAAGFTVLGDHVLGAVREEDIGTRKAEDWLPEVLAFLETVTPRPDALFLAGGGVCFADAIERFEAEAGLPIVTGPGALVWKASRLVGVSPERPGLGLLYRPKAKPSVDVLQVRQSTGAKSFVVSGTPPVFVAGAGPWLISEESRAYLDFASGSGTTALGHDHPAIKAALTAQGASGVGHLGPHFHAPVQARLYDLLAKILPDHLTRLHPSISGAEAMEVALKAAMHATGARRFIAFEGGYHGRSFGALSVSGARGKNEVLAPFAPAAEILPFPSDVETGQAVAARIRTAEASLAGVIIEPVQATAGLRRADLGGMQAIAEAASTCHVPLIVDEVFTGFGRMGRMFSYEAYGLEPDLVILAKSFGGGMPAGLVAGTEALLGRWPQGVQTSTFQLHPMAAATAEAFLKVLMDEDLVARAQSLAPVFETAFGPCSTHKDVVALRGAGAFWALEMSAPEVALSVRRAALAAGLLTWECGLNAETIGLVPPLIIGEEHIAMAGERLLQAMG